MRILLALALLAWLPVIYDTAQFRAMVVLHCNMPAAFLCCYADVVMAYFCCSPIVPCCMTVICTGLLLRASIGKRISSSCPVPAESEGTYQSQAEVSQPIVAEETSIYTPGTYALPSQPRAEIVSRDADLSAGPPSAAWGNASAFTSSTSAVPAGGATPFGQTATAEPAQVSYTSNAFAALVCL